MSGIEIRQAGNNGWKVLHGTKTIWHWTAVARSLSSTMLIALNGRRCEHEKVWGGVGGPGFPPSWHTLPRNNWDSWVNTASSGSCDRRTAKDMWTTWAPLHTPYRFRPYQHRRTDRQTDRLTDFGEILDTYSTVSGGRCCRWCITVVKSAVLVSVSDCAPSVGRVTEACEYPTIHVWTESSEGLFDTPVLSTLGSQFNVTGPEVTKWRYRSHHMCCGSHSRLYFQGPCWGDAGKSCPSENKTHFVLVVSPQMPYANAKHYLENWKRGSLWHESRWHF